MHRQVTTTGALIPNTTLLGAEKATMIALGYLGAAVLGTSTAVDGLAATPSTPVADLKVNIGVGSLYSFQPVDSTAFGELGTDTSHSIVKQGLLEDAVALTITPPGTAGFSQNYLVQVAYSDVDTSQVINFYNSANPALPFNGPNNAGTSSIVLRSSKAVVSLKAGAAATTGTQSTPSVDAGNTALYVVTVANGATQITSGNISKIATAPFIPVTLPNVPAGVQNCAWSGFDDTGTADALVITPAPVSGSYSRYETWYVKKGASANATTSPTLNVNGLGAKSIVRRDGVALIAGDLVGGGFYGFQYDGTAFRVTSAVASEMQALIAPTTRKKLSGNLTLFVATTGSDANDGLSSGTAFATLQKAWNTALAYDFNGFTGTINVANGSYAPVVCGGALVGIGSPLTFLGNHASPTSVVVNASGAGVSTFNCINGANIAVDGFQVISSTGHGLYAQGAGTNISYANIDFSACGLAHVHAVLGGEVFISASSTYYGIIGAAQAHFSAANGGTIYNNLGALNITFRAATNFSIAFVNCASNASMTLTGMTFLGTGPSGSRYSATLNGSINSGSGGSATYFPGTLAGTTSSGGQYA